MSLRWWLLKHINRAVAKMRGSVGWCAMAYQFSRHGLPEEDDDDEGTWAAIPPRGRLSSWWGAFMFEYKPLVEED